MFRLENHKLNKKLLTLSPKPSWKLLGWIWTDCSVVVRMDPSGQVSVPVGPGTTRGVLERPWMIEARHILKANTNYRVRVEGLGPNRPLYKS